MAHAKTGGKLVKRGGVWVPRRVVQSAYDQLLDRLKYYGHDPISALILIAKDEMNPIHVRLRANEKLIDKLLPDLKAVEQTGEKQQPVVMKFNLPALAPAEQKNE
jgi:hypothetical protein